MAKASKQKVKTMKFTGERFIPSEQGKIRLEHYHRYAIMLDIVGGKNVLDMACGEGYGSSLLANVAQSVNGVDISSEAIRHATEVYKKSNLTFHQASAIALAFPDATFDVVISFETIEHLAEQAEMIAEIRRVLRPDGILIISSPNRPVYSEESGEHNEFHVKELDFNEFDNLLKAEFPFVQYYGQRMLMGSIIQSFTGGKETYRAWHDDGTNLIPKSGELQNPVYFVAIAAANESLLPDIDASIIHPGNMDLVKHYVSFAKWAQDLDITVSEKDKHIVSLGNEIQLRSRQIVNLNQTLSERDEQISDLNQMLIVHTEQISNLNNNLSELNQDIVLLKQSIAERDEQISNLIRALSERDQQIINLDAEIFRRGEWGLRLDAELKAERERLDAVIKSLDAAINSNSWRVTLPLREARLWATKPTQQASRYVRKSLRLAKRFYQTLPFDINTIESHRKIIAKYTPKLLSVTETRLDGKENIHISLDKSLTVFNVPDIPQGHNFFDSAAEYINNANTIDILFSENPLVSIIIPVYGKVNYTLTCLASIAANLPQAPFEVIVVDDCSPDNSVEILANVKGLQLIKNEENQGFIRSCNAGARAAKGKYLYFLNNDTQVTTDWMDELVRTFHEFPGTGLVGSKLIYPDGRLQEAGGIIWQDGNAWNFGRFQDPQLPVFNYAREVDYCSGASIMTPKSLFEELGGFDEHYLPAYCEDSDLALRIRTKGYRVIYQPLSTIIHYEGVTSGTNTSEGTKAYQIENSRKLYLRWKDYLLSHQFPGVDVDNAKDRRAKHRILVLENCTPTPNQDAGSVTVFNLLLLLREMDFQVTFIPEDNFLYMPEYTTALQRTGVEVLYGPYIRSLEQHIEEYGERYNAVFLFRPDLVERNIELIRKYCNRAKLLYYTHDLHFLRMIREAELFQDKEKFKFAKEMKAREFAAINASDASILVSKQELEVIKDKFPKDKLYVLPLILNPSGTDKHFSDRQDIVFIGGFQHTPNIDAVKYFVSEIMPLLRRKLPGICFYVVGSKPTDEIIALASDDVIITGFVEDLTPLLDKMRVSVAPLRYGAGVKGKIGTAMAAGLPVVSTVVGAEGMSLTKGENILLADDPETFAKAIAKVYKDENLWNKISQKGLEFAKKAWGAESAREILSNIFEKLDIDIAHSEYPLSLYSEFDVLKSEINLAKNEELS